MTLFRFRGPVGLLLLAALALPAAGLFSATAFAEGDTGEAADTAEIPWELDMTKAKAKAKAEGKDLLINFTGSDWCGWCTKLEGEVFHKKAFLDTALKSYVMVFLDFPNAEELKAKVVDPAMNEKLKNDYAVRGYPTIMLTNADGLPYGKTGYQDGGPAGYLKHMEEIKSKGKGLMDLAAAGEKATEEQFKTGAKALVDTGLMTYPAYKWIVDEAKSIDPKDWLGMKTVFLAQEEEKELKAALPKSRGVQPDWDKISKLLLKSKYISGGLFLNLGFNCANYLLAEAGKPAEAKKLAELLTRDEIYKNNEKAKVAIDGFIKKATEAVEAAKAAKAAKAETTEPAESGK